MSENDRPASNERQRLFSMVLARVITQVGFLTVVVIGLSLAGGMWLDHHFGTRPWWTIGLLVGSIPVTVALMYAVVRRAARQLEPSPPSGEQHPQA